MVENLNGTGEFATKKGQNAWEKAERKAGPLFLQRIHSPEANPFYAYSTFCRERRGLALSFGVANPADIGIIQKRSLRDISNTAFHQQSLNQTTQLEGIKIIKVEAGRIAKMLEPKKRPAGTSTLN